MYIHVCMYICVRVLCHMYVSHEVRILCKYWHVCSCGRIIGKVSNVRILCIATSLFYFIIIIIFVHNVLRLMYTLFSFLISSLTFFNTYRFLGSVLIFSCDQAALRTLLSVRPPVCLSVCLSLSITPFSTMFLSSYHPEISRSYYYW